MTYYHPCRSPPPRASLKVDMVTGSKLDRNFHQPLPVHHATVCHHSLIHQHWLTIVLMLWEPACNAGICMQDGLPGWDVMSRVLLSSVLMGFWKPHNDSTNCTSMFMMRSSPCLREMLRILFFCFIHNIYIFRPSFTFSKWSSTVKGCPTYRTQEAGHIEINKWDCTALYRTLQSMTYLWK